jgi:ADP-ribose pyrophosphatase YjhB (NUDIX family)
MKYCSQCGSSVRVGIPQGDNRERHICDNCNTIHYQNPKIVAGCIPVWEDKVLLCKRAIEPRYGLWTVPAGFMENGESTHEGAVRETWEEAKARVNLQALYITVNLPKIDQVYMLFRAQLADLNFAPGEESLEVRLFSRQEIPWGQLAFPTVVLTLQHYFADLAQGYFPTHMLDIVRDPTHPKGYQVTSVPNG